MPELIWKGKEQVVNHHLDVPVQILDRQYDFNCPGGGESGNKIIHGDNLAALKALLPQYEGKVKCIYIDPPYNTGNESWVYNDNVKDPRILKWLGDVVGKEGEDLCRHDKWLCMMYPRLQLLKRLLAEDGVIFVSIDENEHRYLELLLEEIFGAANKVQTLIWKKSYGGGSKSKHFVNLHEYIVCFAKNKDVIGSLDLPPDEKAIKYYKYSDAKIAIRGPYRLQPLATNSMDARPNLRYPIIYEGVEIWPEKQWQWSRERTELAQNNDELVFTKKNDRITVSYKQYLRSVDGEERRAKAYSIIDGIYTQQGTNEIKNMFGDGKTFSFPKPSDLIEYLLQLVSVKDDIILDSFAGSGTTAQAVLNLNKRDDGNRRFILLEMMDYAETITAERIKRVINGYGEGSKAVAGTGGDFSYYSLGERVFDDEGNLNEALSVDKIREYVAWSERLPGEESTDNPYWLGEKDQIGYYFFYEPTRATVLNLDFLATLTRKTDGYLIYADTCLLDEEFMRRHTIRFKKIPRDISRF
jgi:adenine-specific DNA-methyltransferase